MKSETVRYLADTIERRDKRHLRVRFPWGWLVIMAAELAVLWWLW